MSNEQSFPVRIDLVGEHAIPQGAYYRKQFALEYDTGTLWNTANYTPYMRIRSAVGGPVQLDLHGYQGRLLVGIRGTPPHQYNLAIVLSGSVTQPLTPWGVGVYDLILRAPDSSDWLRIFEGTIEMSPMVSPPF